MSPGHRRAVGDLISRHIKRSKEALLFGAVWMLLAHLVDMYWLVMPEYNNGEWVLDRHRRAGDRRRDRLFVFVLPSDARRRNLRPIGDPRAGESLAFTNF